MLFSIKKNSFPLQYFSSLLLVLEIFSFLFISPLATIPENPNFILCLVSVSFRFGVPCKRAKGVVSKLSIDSWADFWRISLPFLQVASGFAIRHYQTNLKIFVPALLTKIRYIAIMVTLSILFCEKETTSVEIELTKNFE